MEITNPDGFNADFGGFSDLSNRNHLEGRKNDKMSPQN